MEDAPVVADRNLVTSARAPFRGFLRGDRGRRRVRKEYVQVEEAGCVAHLKRIFRLGRLRLRAMRCPVRVHIGGNRTKSPQARKACRTTLYTLFGGRSAHLSPYLDFGLFYLVGCIPLTMKAR